MIWVGIILIIVVFVIFVNATEKVKYGEFGHASWLLASFGIYQWGQALVLSAFWILYGLACIFWWTPTQALRAYILFHMVRALVELFMLLDEKYQGMAYGIAPGTNRISDEQRMQLYKMGQGIIMLSGRLIIIS